MRLANILTNLSWKKAGQKQHLGKRQVVWIPTVPPLDEESIVKVLQAENNIGQDLSIPTTSSIPNNKTINEESSKTEKEDVYRNSGGQNVEGIVGAEKLDRAVNTDNCTCEKITAIPEKKDIDWLSYPYNSGDRYTLKNRANKVKERVLNCTTTNQLNELLFSRKANEIELNWLVENYFTEAEKAQLCQISRSTQTNLFSEPHPIAEVIKYEFNEIKNDIDFQMERLGWSTERGRQHLIDTYGKKSRVHLTDEELLEFWEYLKNV